MLVKAFIAFLLGTLLSSPVLVQEDKGYSANRFDVDVAVQTGGSLHVTEQVDFRFDGGPFTFVFRELPTDHTDGIENIQAGVDGVPWPLGDEPGQVEIEDGDPIRVTWHLPPTTDSTLSFDLSYDALGVVRQAANSDILDWQALPEDYEYTIDTSQVVFTYPPSAVLQDSPVLLEGNGVILQLTKNNVRISSVDLGPDEPIVARLTFEPGMLITSPPAWQAQQRAADSLAWVWGVLAAIALLGGGFAIIRSAQPYQRSKHDGKSISYVPPSKLSPALAGVISGHDTAVSWQHALATVFDFAGRGYLTIEEMPDRKWYEGEDFVIRVDSWPVDMLPHEQALMDMVFRDKSGAEIMSVTGTEMSKAVSSGNWNTYKDAVTDELILQDMISPKRQEVTQRYQALALILMVASAIMFVSAFLLREQFGLWTLLLVGAVFVLGFLSFIVSSTISTRTKYGEQMDDAWDPFRRFIEQASKGKEPIVDADLFERYLPYAIAFGVAEGWAKQNEKAGWQEVPSYFRALNQDSDFSTAAFIAVIAASSSSGGAASASASGAGAGAAGGGASGAG